jgi:hypothetical protein
VRGEWQRWVGVASLPPDDNGMNQRSGGKVAVGMLASFVAVAKNSMEKRWATRPIFALAKMD